MLLAYFVSAALLYNHTATNGDSSSAGLI